MERDTLVLGKAMRNIQLFVGLLWNFCTDWKMLALLIQPVLRCENLIKTQMYLDAKIINTYCLHELPEMLGYRFYVFKISLKSLPNQWNGKSLSLTEQREIVTGHLYECRYFRRRRKCWCLRTDRLWNIYKIVSNYALISIKNHILPVMFWECFRKIFCVMRQSSPNQWNGKSLGLAK